MQRRTFDILRWTLLLLGGVLLPFLYHRMWMPVSPEGLDKALFERGIVTPMLLWLNGYLGTLFNLRFLGNLGWWIVPMLLWALLNWHRSERWQRGLITLVLLSFAIIGGLGGFNYRYALTLLPVLVVASFLVLWQAFEHFQLPQWPRWSYLFALAAVGIWNTALALDHRKRVHAALSNASSIRSDATTLNKRLDPLSRDLDAWLEESGVKAGDTLLVNNLPEYYYTTGRPGVYYWCGSDQVFLADGPLFVFKDRTDEQAATYLRDSLHCSGILSTRDLSAFDARFNTFLQDHCTLLGEAGRGYTVHRIIPAHP